METSYKKSALKFLKNTDKNTRDKILCGIQGLTKMPPEGDIKVLQGRTGEFRLRIGRYRVIYEYQNKLLMILGIGSRGGMPCQKLQQKL